MNKNLFFIFLIILSPALIAGETCFIKTYPKVWTIDGTSPSEVSSIIKKSNCSQNIKTSFLHFLLTRNGSIHSSIIEKDIKANLKKRVVISPRKIRINSLNQKLKDKFSRSENWFFKDLALSSKKKILGISKNSKLLLHCNQCEFAGSKMLNLSSRTPLQIPTDKNGRKLKLKLE